MTRWTPIAREFASQAGSAVAVRLTGRMAPATFALEVRASTGSWTLAVWQVNPRADDGANATRSAVGSALTRQPYPFHGEIRVVEQTPDGPVEILSCRVRVERG